MTTPPPPGFGGTEVPAAFGGPGQPADISGLVRQGLAASGQADGTAGRRRGWRLAVGLGLLLAGVAGVFVRALLLHENLGFWQYTWVTLPVAAAAGYLGYRLALGRGLGVGRIGALLVGTVGTSWLTGLSSGAEISNPLFNTDITCLLQQQTDCASPAATESPWQAAQRIATNYWDLYGPVGIVSALVVGLVAGIGLALVANRNLRRG